MAVMSLAMAAVAAFATAIGGQLGGDVVAGFRSLVQRRFAGDSHAESALAAVEWNPGDAGAHQMLTQALAHYATHDPDFRQALADTVNYMEFHINQSHSANWQVGGPNYGTISTPITDNRVYQSGGYVAGRDVWVDQSRFQVDTDPMAPIRDATGFPKVLMVMGMLVSFAGAAVLLYTMYGFSTTVTSTNLGPGVNPRSLVQPLSQQFIIGMGIMVVGGVVTVIGRLFRPKGR
jgi:hypothetical protein